MWNTRFLIAAVTVASILGAGWQLYGLGKKRGMSEVQQQWDAEKAATAQAQAEELMKARQRESALQELATRLRKEKADEARRLAREYAADLERLRDRPDARAGAGGVPEGAAPGVGCTGEGLSRRDAEFLVGLAHDAARTQAALDQCRAQYAEVERALNR